MKGKIIKKIGKALLWIIGIFFALDLLIVGLIFIPPIQNYIISKVTTSISNKWGAEIGVRRIYVTPTLSLVADDFVIKDLRNQPMISVKKVKGRLKSLQTKPFTLSFFSVTATEADVTLVTYEGDTRVNISAWAKKISKPKKNPKDFILRINNIRLIDSRFSIANQNKQQKTPYIEGQEFDPGFFEMRHIDFKATKFQVYNDDISAHIKQIGYDQYFGFHLIRGSGDFQINSKLLRFDDCKLLTDNSKLDLDLRFNYNTWKNLGDFLDSVNITATIRPSDFCLRDAACYAAAIRGMDSRFHFQGLVNGCVNDFRLIDFDCHYNNSTFFTGNFSLKDITDFKHAIWKLDFDDSYFNMQELADFSLPKGKKLPLPNTVKRIGYAQIQGALSGYVPAITAKLDIRTGAGNMKTDISSKDIGEQVTFGGTLTTNNFNLGRVLNSSNYFGQANLVLSLDGISDDPMDKPEFLSTLIVDIQSDISRFDIIGYPVQDIKLTGQYHEKKCAAQLISNDQKLNLIFNGLADFSLLQPSIQANLSLHNIKLSEIASHHPPIDSAKAKGIDKLIYFAQQNKQVEITLDSLIFNTIGKDLDHLNGYVGIDGLHIFNEIRPFDSDRIRFTAINTATGVHKYILSSDFINASLNTNYEYKEIIDSLLNFAYHYIPNVLPQRNTGKNDIAFQTNRYFNFSVETFDTEPLLFIFLPELFVAEYSSIDLKLGGNEQQNHINILIPHVSLNNRFSVNNLQLTSNVSSNHHLLTHVTCDSITVSNKKNAILSLNQLAIRADMYKSYIDYQLLWKDIADNNRPFSRLNGTIDARDRQNIVARFTDSQILLNEYNFKFNNHNAITFQKQRIIAENLVLNDKNSSISINGAFSKLPDDKLSIAINNVGINIANNFIRGISFDGMLSANADIMMRNGNRIIMGKLMAVDFTLNKSNLGNVFLTAGIGNNGSLGFSGGIFHRDNPIPSTIINEYTIKNYKAENDKLANINGYYLSHIKRFVAKANVGSLNLGFLQPFLSSFCDHVSGTASGELSFIASPDSSFISGKAHVNNMIMGISPLGIQYNINNQEVTFNRNGITFDRITLEDPDGNTGTLNGHIHHKLFKDMRIDLDINTSKIQVLNLSRNMNSSFYGKGYVSGNVRISGNDKELSFSSNNLTTLKGSSLYFPITSSQSVSENSNIRFRTVIQDSVIVTTSMEEKTKLNFDFIFNVTPETDIQVDVTSIGGTMRAKAIGRLHLLYNDDNGINIFGDMEINSGDFLLSLENIVNTKLKLAPGGKVIFDGPIADFNVNISAYYSARTSLSSIMNSEEFASTSRIPVNAYIHMNGQLMKYPNIDFSFELPNLSQDLSKQVFMVIDTTDPQNRSKQFFIFLLTNQFLPDDASSSDISNTVGNGGISILTNFVNNFLSRQMKHGGVGIVYKSANQQNAAEYGLNANMQFLNDRMIFESNIGYYDNNNAYGGKKSIENFYGDFSLEYLITPKGNWRIKIYNFSDQYVIESYKKIPGVGLALMYKQDFNNKNDFSEEFKNAKIEIKKREKKNKKK